MPRTRDIDNAIGKTHEKSQNVALKTFGLRLRGPRETDSRVTRRRVRSAAMESPRHVLSTITFPIVFPRVCPKRAGNVREIHRGREFRSTFGRRGVARVSGASYTSGGDRHNSVRYPSDAVVDGK